MTLLLLLGERASEMVFHVDRGAIRLRWDSAGTERAYVVQMVDYAGDDLDKPTMYQRNFSTGKLLRSQGGLIRIVKCNFLAKEYPDGHYINGVLEGSIEELRAAHAASDLECLSFADDAYWDAEWMGTFPPRLRFDPLRKLAIIPAHIEQRILS